MIMMPESIRALSMYRLLARRAVAPGRGKIFCSRQILAKIRTGNDNSDSFKSGNSLLTLRRSLHQSHIEGIFWHWQEFRVRVVLTVCELVTGIGLIWFTPRLDSRSWTWYPDCWWHGMAQAGQKSGIVEGGRRERW